MSVVEHHCIEINLFLEWGLTTVLARIDLMIASLVLL